MTATASPNTTETRCQWAYHCPTCEHLLMFCTCLAISREISPALDADVPADAVITTTARPNLDELQIALFADLRKAEARYKLICLDDTLPVSNRQNAYRQVQNLRTTLETLNLYVDGWENLHGANADAPLIIETLPPAYALAEAA